MVSACLTTEYTEQTGAYSGLMTTQTDDHFLQILQFQNDNRSQVHLSK